MSRSPSGEEGAEREAGESALSPPVASLPPPPFLDGGAGDDTLSGGKGADTLSGGAGNDVFYGTRSRLDGDRIADYGDGDVIRVRGLNADRAQVLLSSEDGVTTVGIDRNGDGTAETTLTVDGVFDSATIADAGNGTADITLEAPLPPPIGTNLLANSDFENVSGFNHGSWGTFSQIEGWTAEDSDPSTTAVAPIEIQIGRQGGAPVSPEGWESDNQVLELDSHAENGGVSGETNAKITQTFTVFEAATYALSFDFAARQRGSQIAETSEFSIEIDGQTVYTKTDAGLVWTSDWLTLELGVGVHTISFVGGDADGSSDSYGALIDNVELVQGTEPVRELLPNLNATEGADTLIGTAGADTVNGLGGDDAVSGMAGDDVLSGGAGTDTLIGGVGGDTLVGGAGSDVFEAVSADLDGDVIADFEDGDSIRLTDIAPGQTVSVLVDAGVTIVTILAADGTTIAATFTVNGEYPGAALISDGVNGSLLTLSVVVQATTGADVITGTSGADTIDALGGDDVLSGGAGNDVLSGGAGADSLFGGLGDDVIWADALDGQLDGGDGNDVLVVAQGTDLSTLDHNGFETAWLVDNQGAVVETVDLTAPLEATGPIYTFLNSANQITSLQFSAGVSEVLETLNVASPWSIIGTPDFNGDGTDDVFWRATNGFVSRWTLDDVDGFTPESAVPVSPDWAVLATGDFDGGGQADILWRNTVTGGTTTWINGTPSASTVGVVPDWSIEEVADFDGDGTDEVLWRNGTTDQATVWSFGNDGTAITGTQIGLSDAWTKQGLGDFDGDGGQDILWRNDASGTAAIWTGIGTDGAAFHPGIALSNAWAVVSTDNDFNGDGKDDILFRNESAGLATVWEMDGGTPTFGPALAAANVWSPDATGDFDGDGKDDILWRSDFGQVSVWEMDGTAAETMYSFTLANEWQILDVARLDGGPTDDLVIRHADGRFATVAMADGAEPTITIASDSLSSDWTLV